MDLKIKLGLNKGINIGSSGISGGGAGTFAISGVVYDADGSTPVAGATIALGAYSTTSAANGTYTLTGIPAGTSGSMTCTKAGYLWTAKSIAAMSGNLTSQNYDALWYTVGGISARVLRAYQGIGAATIAASKVNLINPGTGNLTSTAEPSFDTVDGWTGNGTSQYWDTGLTPTINTCVMARFSNVTNTGYVYGDDRVAGAKLYGRPDGGGGAVLTYYGNGANVKAPTMTSGVMGSILTRTYRDGVYDGNAGAWTDTSIATVYLFARNIGSVATPLAGKIQAVIFFDGNGLDATASDTIAANLNAVMAALP